MPRVSPYEIAPERAARLVSCLRENAAAIDAEGAFPVAEFEWLRQAGLLAAPLPHTQGGWGLGTQPGSTRALLETLWHIGRGNLAVGRLYEGHVNALQLVETYANSQQKERLYADARAGRIFAVWNTQAQDGVSFERGENLEMRGAKTFCSGAGWVSRPIVTGALGEGWQMAIPRIETLSCAVDQSWWKPLGMRASASFKTDFSGAQIGADDLIGAPDDYYRQPLFSGGAIRFCAVQLGGAASLGEATRDFLCETGRTDDPFQQARVGQMATRIESGRHWLDGAARLWERAPNAATLVAYAAMVRLATEEICNAALEMAEKSVGARGLLRPHPIERIGRDLTIYLKQPPPGRDSAARRAPCAKRR